jgi:hypothetical protein
MDLGLTVRRVRKEIEDEIDAAEDSSEMLSALQIRTIGVQVAEMIRTPRAAANGVINHA